MLGNVLRPFERVVCRQVGVPLYDNLVLDVVYVVCNAVNHDFCRG